LEQRALLALEAVMQPQPYGTLTTELMFRNELHHRNDWNRGIATNYV